MAICAQENDGKNLREKLGAAVRSIQWSYAIFWAPSLAEPSSLEWAEGYYNGDIKTRKTTMPMEMEIDIGSERSDQLRELYEFLLLGEGNSHAQRPSAALSPEDLTNTEWYYLVCMSFTFNIGQGLPGRSLADGETIWLSETHSAETSYFCRSLLAKSAGIKTVLCFPFLCGVIELGVTDMVYEDVNLIHTVRSTFSEISDLKPYPNFTELLPFMQDEDMKLVYPSASSCGFGQVQIPEDTILDDELSNDVHSDFKNSSDGITHSVALLEDDVPVSQRDGVSQYSNPQKKPDLQLDPASENLHYLNALKSIIETSHSHRIMHEPPFHNLTKGSSASAFICWKTEGTKVYDLKSETSQKMLKKMLLEVPLMHSSESLERNESTTSHVLAERRRREKVNERLSVLKTMIPSIHKVDKISILDDTIAHIKELKRRLEELKSYQEKSEDNRRNKRTQDNEERTSDNYGRDINVGAKKKRKSNKIDDHEFSQIAMDSSSSLTVHKALQDVIINIRCPWKESLLLDIIDNMSNIHLESHTVQSDTVDGILSLSIKCRLRESDCFSVGMIIKSLQSVLRNHHKQDSTLI